MFVRKVQDTERYYNVYINIRVCMNIHICMYTIERVYFLQYWTLLWLKVESYVNLCQFINLTNYELN